MSAAAPPPLPSTLRLRRHPRQERSRRLVVALVDAAEHVLATRGADALSTTSVAEAAGVSVGALYQWFGDRDALVEALALRYLDDFQALGRELAAAPPVDDPAALVVDAFAEAFRSRPGFRALWFGGLRTERLRDLTRPGLAELAGSLDAVLVAAAPDAPVARRATVAATSVRVLDSLLRQAFRLDPEGDPALLAETRTLLRAYWRDQLDIDPHEEPA